MIFLAGVWFNLGVAVVTHLCVVSTGGVDVTGACFIWTGKFVEYCCGKG